jgi:hypothetical protein
MIRITDTLPPFWWLNPWRLVVAYHTALRAMQAMAEQDDRVRTALADRVVELEDGLDRIHASIISGGAIVPDAQPQEDDAGE